jgi:hypothetical protein
VADDHVPATDVLEHARRYFAGEGAERLRAHGLRAERDARRFEQPGGFPQVDERRAHGDFDRRLAGQPEQQRFDQLSVFCTRAVHFPVSGDQRPPHRTTSNQPRGPAKGAEA